MVTPVTPEVTITSAKLATIDLPNVVVSGSYATGKATAKSDIDLLVGIPAADWDKVTLYDFPDTIKILYDTLPEDKMSIHLYKLSEPNKLWHFQRPRVEGGKHFSGVFLPVDYSQEMIQGLWDKAIKPTLIPKAEASTHPLILKQYPLGQVPEKMPINLDIPIPPLRGTVAPRTKVVVPENAALRTNVELDRAVEHLGYQSVSLSEEEVAGLEKPIPTDIELINEAQRRLRRLKVIPDGQLNTRQLAHLNLARVLAQTICYRNPVSGVYAASIPPASDRVRTVGTYGTKNKAGYIALDALDTGRITIDTLIHELGHHQQYLKMGEAEDLEIEHAEAMASIAGETVAIVGTGKLDKLLVDVAW